MAYIVIYARHTDLRSFIQDGIFAVISTFINTVSTHFKHKKAVGTYDRSDCY